jgi:hypothetical protein
MEIHNFGLVKMHEEDAQKKMIFSTIIKQQKFYNVHIAWSS